VDGGPRLVGINHVALEVGDIDDALEFYGRLFSFTLRGRSPGAAFIDMGDQFIALMRTANDERDGARHFGLVVDDAAASADGWRTKASTCSADVVSTSSIRWATASRSCSTTTCIHEGEPVLRGMGLELGKSEAAAAELESKGLR
jgi:predicted enzyme related to lactoylglutathione lyase